MVKIRCSKIKQTKAKIYIPNQLLRKHPLCFSVSPVFSKTFGNRAFCLFVFHQILISSCTIRVRTLFKLVAQIFLNAFTKISPLCCCTVKTIHPTHTALAMLKWDRVAVTLAAGIVNVSKITAWERQILLQNQGLDLETMDGGHWKECKRQDAIFHSFEKWNTWEVSKYLFRALHRNYFNFHWFV